MKPEEIICVSLINCFPVHHIIVADGCIKTGKQSNIGRLVARSLFQRHTVADDAKMFVCQTRETFTDDLNTCPFWTFPTYRATQDANAKVQTTVVVEDLALVQAEALTVDEQSYRKPIRSVGE